MMQPQESYHSTIESVPNEEEIARLTSRVYAQVFRTDFTQPGFALLSFGQQVEYLSLGRFMVTLKDAINETYRQKTERSLYCLSMLQFDQQTTTKFHLDGAPEESYLMLGYEPTSVKSALCMADYTKAAQEMNLTPQQFLAEYNPMFARGEQQLAPYITRVEGFDAQQAHLLLINNSRLPYCPEKANSLGVMHQATILNPDPNQSRIINSVMLAVSPTGDIPVDTLGIE